MPNHRDTLPCTSPAVGWSKVQCSSMMPNTYDVKVLLILDMRVHANIIKELRISATLKYSAIKSTETSVVTITSAGSRISHRGRQPRRGALTPDTRFVKFVCQNDRIWILGGGTRGVRPLDLIPYLVAILFP